MKSLSSLVHGGPQRGKQLEICGTKKTVNHAGTVDTYTSGKNFQKKIAEGDHELLLE
jgi:hypothetical protein